MPLDLPHNQSGRSNSHLPSTAFLRPMAQPMPIEGLEMLISQRRKKESEHQLKMLENRIKRLRDTDSQTQ